MSRLGITVGLLIAAIAGLPAVAAEPFLGVRLWSMAKRSTSTVSGCGKAASMRPEKWQRCKRSARVSYRCGRNVAFAIDDLLAASRPTMCRSLERESGHGGERWVGGCHRADGADVSIWLVSNGWAVYSPKYSGGLHVAAQARLKGRSVGFWRRHFEMPYVARARRRGNEPPTNWVEPVTGRPVR